MLTATLSSIGPTVAAFVTTFYMPNYAIRELGMSPVVALFGAALTGLVTFSGSPLVGRWSDRIGRKPLIFWSRIVLVLSVYPGFLWLN
ncbi:MFS transporter, partial [Ottowia sp.]|uniref:MFS transporter n=1 Tax=Ottowia sp. TaxID=1898956 RepID=UPI00345E2012